MGERTQPARERNRAAIADHFASGAKEEARAVGIELEHTLSHADGAPLGYDGPFAAKQLLESLEDGFPEQMLDGDALIGVAGDGETVTLEPAAQVELSAGPFTTMASAEERLEGFEARLRQLCDAHGITVSTRGYNPIHRAADLPLIPKRRYEMMNAYLGAISMYGICMMRGSASTQVSIDYTSVDDCLRKLRLANACVPLFSLICDNSPIFEGRPREHELVRTRIWEGCDPDRCGTVPGVMDPSFTLEAYADYVLDTPAIVAHAPAGDIPSEKSFGELFSDEEMGGADIEHAISMLFNDVRLKTYIEIRPADAMPVRYALAYAALVKGLFCDSAALDAMDGLFAGVTEDAIAQAKHALMGRGYDAMVYGRPASELADELLRISSAGLCSDDLPYLDPIAALIGGRTTLADMPER